MGTHYTSSLARRGNLGNVGRNGAVHQAYCEPVEKPTSEEHGNVNRAGLDGSRNDTEKTDQLNRQFPANPIQEPIDHPAADEPACGVEAVSGADDRTAIGGSRFEIEVRVERRETND